MKKITIEFPLENFLTVDTALQACGFEICAVNKVEGMYRAQIKPDEHLQNSDLLHIAIYNLSRHLFKMGL